MEEKEVYSSRDQILIDQICQILKNNDINNIRRDEGATAYLNVALGNNLGVKRIFVNSDQFEKAIKIINDFFQNNEEYIKEELRENDKNEENIPEELRKSNEEDNLEEDIKKYKKMEKIYAWIPLSLTIIAILLTIILPKIMKII